MPSNGGPGNPGRVLLEDRVRSTPAFAIPARGVDAADETFELLTVGPNSERISPALRDALLRVMGEMRESPFDPLSRPLSPDEAYQRVCNMLALNPPA